MKTDELREMYLDFFEGKGCRRERSDVLVPKEDKTVLFTPAGMNQFKNQFLGIGQLEFTKATTCQKCLRTGDIGNVGVTAYHHTFFEMLGNFSFGDYFKKEAIHWAWEFLTQKQWLNLDPDRLTVTVYLDDDEAFNIWEKEVGLSPDRIRRDNEYENFWPAGAPTDGPDGVCGPCSEIFFHPPSHPVGSGHDVEIWNLVFTQFNRVGNPPDNLRPLPKQNIDTGMGLERTAAVLQGVESNFEIDILKPLCLAAADAVGVKYEFGGKTGRPLRRIADHLRAITFCIHENVNPGSKEAGYIVRLLLRRALLEGYLLGQQEPFLSKIVPAVVEQMKTPYPELSRTASNVADVIEEEENLFLHTIERGLTRYQDVVQKTKSSGKKQIPGDAAFDLHQTWGFIIDLTETLAAQEGLSVDRESFLACEEKHHQVSGKGSFSDSVMAAGPLDDIENETGSTSFLGYETTSASGTIVGIVAEKQSVSEYGSDQNEAAIILEATPFYGESGGQVGDTGLISSASGTFEVHNTQKHSGLTVHIGKLTSGSLKVGSEVTAEVTSDRRAGIRRAHSATHLLHHALQTTLGETATQRGSKVEDDLLRFDFSHKSALTEEELIRIEDIINARIAEGSEIEVEYMSLDEARKKGAMALFGEKYPDRVRVVSMGDFSRELCGGTHLTNTGQVGFCKLLSEENIASGVRRMTALTGRRALLHMRERENILAELTELLKTPQPEDLTRRVTQLQNELREVKQKLSSHEKKSVASSVDDLIDSAEEVDGVKLISHQVKNGSREQLRDFVDQIRRKCSSAAIILGTEIEGKVALIAAVTKNLLEKVKASDCIKVAAKVAGGGGGGRPDMAEAGGSKPEKIPEALKEGIKFYKEHLS